MSTTYLTADHQHPPALIERNGMLIPRGIYEADPATYDLVPHVTPDGPAPLGYSEWTESNGEYSRTINGTEGEIQAALLDQWRATAEVTALQGMLAIQQLGVTAVAGFNAWLSSLDPITDFAAIAFFQKAQTWKRDNPYLIQGATALGLTDEQLDDLFQLAATL